jgi:hypothetical protein
MLATVLETERSILNETLAIEQRELPSGRAWGIPWDAQSDTLGLSYAHVERPPTQLTPRGILAKLAGLYDPLGWSIQFHLWCVQSCNEHVPMDLLKWNTPLQAHIAAER